MEHSTKIDHVQDHKVDLNKSERIEIIQTMLFEYSRIKLEINDENISRKLLNIWKLIISKYPVDLRRNYKKN